MVVLLRVVAIYLLASLANLLDNEELRFGLRYSFDRRLFVSRDHDEVVPLAHDRCVAARRDLDRLDTGRAAALAMKGQRP
jgi:hypothetical protein